MTKKFTWERGPFSQCPSCQQETFGFLSAGGETMTMRCTECRYSHSELLPELNKKLIYLDQFAFSAMFQIESNGKPHGKHQAFWEAAHALLRKIVLLQQAILPHSDIHHHETVVSPFAKGLRECYEHLGGDARFEDNNTVQQAQVLEFAQAYIEVREPNIDLSSESVLKRDGNRWLEDMHISVNVDYSMFADGTWAERGRTSTAVESLIAGWIVEKPSFETIFEREQMAFGSSRREALAYFAKQADEAISAGNMMAAINASLQPICNEFQLLRHAFRKAGVEEANLTEAISRFWDWPMNREQPNSRISSFLFAALARKVASGQRKVTPGFMNDVRAISTYLPFVDAMFLDNECVGLLSESPLKEEIDYGTRIFSLNTQKEFIQYLEDIEAKTPDDVREYAAQIYGVG